MHALQRSFFALCLIGSAVSQMDRLFDDQPPQFSEPSVVDATQAVSESANRFSVNFFKKVADEHQGNLICSPLSANVALSMAATGAGGNTKAQFTQILHHPSLSDTLTGYQRLINNLNDVENVTLKLANKMFIADNFEVKPDFKRDLQTYFRSDIDMVDFNDKVKTANTINTWCKERTNNRIDSIIQPDDLDPATALVLANAVYFKGKWANEFDPKLTQNRPFHVDGSTTKDVPTMYKRGYFKFVDLPNYNAKCIQLPYANKEVSLVIILPNEDSSLSQITEKMDEILPYSLERLNTAYEREVKLYLPKFKTESKLDLEDTLSNKMGLSEPFSNSANFSGISPLPLKISKVVQKAFIEVNEEGSEAAAVTDVEINNRMMPFYISVAINRPFFYSIVKTNTYKETCNFLSLFTGTVLEP